MKETNTLKVVLSKELALKHVTADCCLKMITLMVIGLICCLVKYYERTLLTVAKSARTIIFVVIGAMLLLLWLT